MRSRATSRSSPGFLLVEAIVSAVVIAVALSFISRGLSSQLRVLGRLEEYQTVLRLAHGKMLELEGVLVPGGSLETGLRGTFEDPHDAYQWEITTEPRQDLLGEDDVQLASDITLTVTHTQRSSPSVRLGAVWLREWLP